MTTQTRKIIRWEEGAASEVEDEVITEVALTLHVNGREFLTLMSLGECQDELAVGYLRSEGFLNDLSQLRSLGVAGARVDVEADIDLDLLERLSEKRVVTTGCGKGTVFHRPLDGLTLKPPTGYAFFSPEAILGRMRDLEGRSEVFQRTGGVHYAALAAPEALLHLRSDIGRHNAVDMLVGRAFLDTLDTGALALLVTGRVSSEVLRKTAAMGVGILVSRSAPTTLALEMAEALNVTVIGYARARRFNIYTRPERVNLGGRTTYG